MQSQTGTRVAIIGAGISGISAAAILQKNGYDVVIFEKSEKLGGIWAFTYPDVHLQNTYHQYHLSNFPWPFKPDFHPSGAQVLQYWENVVYNLHLDVRLCHEITRLEEKSDSWMVSYKNQLGNHQEIFKYVVVAVGQYTESKHRPNFTGEEMFGGEIITERDVRTLDIFNDKQVAVIGFGKSALDMSIFAATRGREVHHIFRIPRWTIPEWILGIHTSHILFSRFGSVMMTSWAYPTAFERFLHGKLGGGVEKFWDMIKSVIQWQITRIGKNKDVVAKERLKTLIPSHRFIHDMRSAGAVAPETYYPFVVDGKIQPYHDEVKGFSNNKILLKGGREIPCDLVVLSLGSKTPEFPFLPEKYRKMLEGEPDGTQLYRHLIHPRIPNLGFAGFNHCFMHIPAVEIGTQWLCAYWRGEIKLPPINDMEQSMERIRTWKRANINFEPSRLFALNTRFQQYNDILLKDLGLSPYRKLPNIIAEIFGRYGASDYASVVEEYNNKNIPKKRSLNPINVDT
jgi:dimethylaniline monooxygenase (N-oxide forming)